MMGFRGVWGAISALFLLAACATEVAPCSNCQGPVQTRGAYFPAISVTDLNGQTRQLPQALPGQRTLVFIAFTPSDQSGISRWIRAMRLTPDSPVAWAGLAAIPPRYEIFSGAIENRFRQGFRDPRDRARLFSLYDSQGLVDGLQLRRANEFVLVVTTRDGDVVLKEKGEPTAAKVRRVHAALGL